MFCILFFSLCCVRFEPIIHDLRKHSGGLNIGAGTVRNANILQGPDLYLESLHTHTHTPHVCARVHTRMHTHALQDTASNWKSERQSTSPQKEILVWTRVIKQNIF